jgi:uncharacterized protein YunC (DUF1805 family)/outer membrane murein-binding lipoprotein Lpp
LLALDESLSSFIYTALVVSVLFVSGCERPPVDPPAVSPQDAQASYDAAASQDSTVSQDSTASQDSAASASKLAEAGADDPIWRGLERHEIQLDQKLLVVKGSKGVVGCPYLNAASFEKFGEACAIIPAVDTAGMLNSKVTAVTPEARKLGIEVGMPGREALDKIR